MKAVRINTDYGAQVPAISETYLTGPQIATLLKMGYSTYQDDSLDPRILRALARSGIIQFDSRDA